MLKSLLLVAALLLAASNSFAQWLPQSSIMITYPKAGDVLMASQFYTRVEVKAEGEFHAPVLYEFTTNKGTTWELIKKDVYPGKTYIGNFHWEVPNINAQHVQLRITDSLGTTGLSQIFRIREIPKILTARVNNNRFPLPVDYDVLIEWTAEGELSPIDIEYHVAGIARYKIVYELDSNQRSYVWRTPPDPVGDVFLTVAAQNGGEVRVGPFEINFTNDVDQAAEAHKRLAVFPNPVSSVLRATCETTAPSVFVRLSDVMGRVMVEREVEVTAGELMLDVATITPGSYVLTVQTSGKTSSRMITISR